MSKKRRSCIRNIIQPIVKRLNELLLKFCPETRCWLVRSVNKMAWLSNGLRRCTGKAPLLSTNELVAPGNLLIACKTDGKRICKKGLSKTINFILQHPQIKTNCKKILIHFPKVTAKLKQIFYSPCGALNNEFLSLSNSASAYEHRLYVQLELLAKKQENKIPCE